MFAEFRDFITGRISRGVFWSLMFGYFVLVVVLFGLAWVADLISGSLNSQIVPGSTLFSLLDGVLSAPRLLVFFSALILPFFILAVSIPRLHDRGKSGGWAMLMLVVPYGLTFHWLENSETSPTVVAFLAVAFWVWALVELGFLGGDKIDNRYGPPPGLY